MERLVSEPAPMRASGRSARTCLPMIVSVYERLSGGQPGERSILCREGG
jgi:hypothetical protein